MPWRTKFSSISQYEQPYLRLWEKPKIQYGRQQRSWMHLHVICNTQWQYIMINCHPVGPNFHPFCSRSNRFWDIEEDGNSNMPASAHLGCTFKLFVQHSDYISWLTLTLWAQIFIRFTPYQEQPFLRYWGRRKIQYGHRRPYWMHLHVIRTTQWLYIMINIKPAGPDFHPFRSRSNRFWDIQKDRKSNMATGGHLGWTFMLFVQHSDYIIMINFNPVGPNFQPFHSRNNHFWDIEENGNSNMAVNGHLGCTFMLFVQHSDYISWLTLTLWAQIFIRFALRTAVSKIQWIKVKNWPILAFQAPIWGP